LRKFDQHISHNVIPFGMKGVFMKILFMI